MIPRISKAIDALETACRRGERMEETRKILETEIDKQFRLQDMVAAEVKRSMAATRFMEKLLEKYGTAMDVEGMAEVAVSAAEALNRKLKRSA